MSDLHLYINKHKLTRSDAAKRFRHYKIPRLQPRAWQMGQVQSLNADPASNIGGAKSSNDPHGGYTWRNLSVSRLAIHL